VIRRLIVRRGRRRLRRALDRHVVTVVPCTTAKPDTGPHGHEAICAVCGPITDACTRWQTAHYTAARHRDDLAYDLRHAVARIHGKATR